MSASPPKAAAEVVNRRVRFGPSPDISRGVIVRRKVRVLAESDVAESPHGGWDIAQTRFHNFTAMKNDVPLS